MYMYIDRERESERERERDCIQHALTPPVRCCKTVECFPKEREIDTACNTP